MISRGSRRAGARRQVSLGDGAARERRAKQRATRRLRGRTRRPDISMRRGTHALSGATKAHVCASPRDAFCEICGTRSRFNSVPIFYIRDPCTFQKRYLGVVSAIQQFRPYLWGRRFRVVTDHAALKWLHTMSGTQEGGPQSRLTRWVIKLQEYDFYVEHKPGKSHVDCDAISRLVAALTPVGEGSIEHPERWDEQRISALLEPEPSACLHSNLQEFKKS